MEFDHNVEYDAYIEAEKGPKIMFAGMSTKQVVAIAGESTQSVLHIRVREPFIDIRAIHSSFVGKVQYSSGNDKDTIVRMHFDIIALLVAAGKLKRGTGTGGIGKRI